MSRFRARPHEDSQSPHNVKYQARGLFVLALTLLSVGTGPTGPTKIQSGLPLAISCRPVHRHRICTLEAGRLRVWGLLALQAKVVRPSW